MAKSPRYRGPPPPAFPVGSVPSGVERETLRRMLDAAVALGLAGGAPPEMIASLLGEVAHAARASALEVGAAEPSIEALLAGQRLIQTWATDPEFLDATATPRLLPRSGRGASFAALVRRTGGFRRPRVALELLERHGVIAREGRSVRLLSRTLLMDAQRRETREWALNAGAAGLRTLARNLARPPDSGEPRYFERMVNSDRFPSADRAALRTHFTFHADAFLRFMDQQLRNYELSGAAAGGPTEAVGFWVVEVSRRPTRRPARRRSPNRRRDDGAREVPPVPL